jgi:RNA polymerase sigma-70 factor (ECF subfamily)
MSTEWYLPLPALQRYAAFPKKRGECTLRSDWKEEIRVQDSDERLAQQAGNGDREAFRSLVTRYKDYVFSLIRRQVRDEFVAEDLTQEVFLKVFRGLGTFRADALFKTWLVRIALNTTNTYFGSRRYKESCATEQFPDEHEVVAPYLTSTSSETDQRLILFHQALAALSPKLRDVLVLCALQEKSYEETADLLSIPVGTVRSRLNSARSHMREEIAKLQNTQRGEDE